MARPTKYHFDMLTKIPQPAIGEWYGDINNIRSSAQQWAKSRGLKIKTMVVTNEHNMQLLRVSLIDYVPPVVEEDEVPF